jgi:hypothetical protein
MFIDKFASIEKQKNGIKAQKLSQKTIKRKLNQVITKRKLNQVTIKRKNAQSKRMPSPFTVKHSQSQKGQQQGQSKQFVAKVKNLPCFPRTART